MGGFLGDILRTVAPSIGTDETITRGGLSAIPGVGQFIGQESANQANAQQSANQMAFQERMSSTAHQREVDDLKKAGLNPILSANAGSSSPPGASATMQNSSEGVSASAMEAIQMVKNLKKIEAETSLLEAQKKKTLTEDRTLKGDATKSEIWDDLWQAIKPISGKISEGFQSGSFKKGNINPNKWSKDKIAEWQYGPQKSIPVGGKK
nr:MAG: DNA pilot protein [Microvirus sp.]